MIIETLNQWWTSLLEFSAAFVTPAWGQLVDLLPILVLVFVVGPIVTLMVLLWFRYLAKKPRVRVEFADTRRAAARGPDGSFVFPAGEPYSPGEGVIYEPGVTRAPSGERLLVACPKCALVRPAAEDTCGNCGLSFTLKPTTRTLRPAGPPPGGRAAA